MNRCFCNKCKKLVSGRSVERDGKIYLTKDCPDCGATETLIAGDAERYWNKRKLDTEFKYGDCALACVGCNHKHPNIVFLDITNRCNLNCPICINNTPSMGFLFEPPMAYFDKIFRHYAAYDPVPAFQLFGGEPTVREDLLDIIKLARSYRIPVRVVTNGLKLTDPDYCYQLVDNRATILIAYDGANPETYRVLRGNASILKAKEKAIRNVGNVRIPRIRRAKVVLMSLVATGLNDKQVGELFQFCHDTGDFIRGIYFMPLAHTWDRKDFDLDPERITSEDVENYVANVYPGERGGFIPAGFLGQVPLLKKYLRVRPIPFIGAHPNCESMYLLVSDGERYVPVGRYLKGTVLDAARDALDIEAKLVRRIEKMEKNLGGRLLARLGWKEGYQRFRALLAAGRMSLRRVRIGAVLKGEGPGKLYHAFALMAGLILRRDSRAAIVRHTRAQGVLQLIILPFEDPYTLETERMERCPSAFAYYDPRKDEVRSVPVCAWSMHKTKVMREIVDYYSEKAGGARVSDRLRGPVAG